MKIRTIKPEFHESEKLAELTPRQRILFIALWKMADDNGNLRYAPKKIIRRVFYLDLDAESQAKIDDLSQRTELHPTTPNSGKQCESEPALGGPRQDKAALGGPRQDKAALGGPGVRTGRNPLDWSPVPIMDELLAGFDLLEQLNITVRYEVDGEEYLSIRNFNEHQHLNKPSRTKVPLPDGSPAGLQFKEAQERMRANPPTPKLRSVNREVS